MIVRRLIAYYLCVAALIVGIACGKQGPKGDPGQSIVGPSGRPGPVGSPGLNGLPGTIVSPIQFCPGVTPTYPVTFPEVGFCINGNIYAVYSANDGFLALIPPGRYESNAVGSACDFTVGPNCEVTQ